ncbi:hypothetical protein DKM44_08355 [Deinococcus irradiatisoli]|uniref:M-like protein n=1 Tax=Deinococcus irradiatisoli TaxID=2202254 RepID=A0A2Z3JQL5_9DEIO|nr:hypothetical protein [Deinococcus irradiatisoli]AWN23234.1 hypothetical protein DKM44_08355 [Deinococcus irradiatisoli]
MTDNNTDKHGINPGSAHETQVPPAPESAQRKGLDGHDVEVIGSMITSDPPSSNMGESSENQAADER